MNGKDMRIIDVSAHQGKIKWDKAKENIDAVIIRAGYGKGNLDKHFQDNIQGALDAGLPIGIYWFSYAYSVDMARKEAQYCNDFICPYKDSIILPVFFDWEYDSMNYAKKNGVKPDKQLITDMNVAFCRRIDDLGYKAGYYLNLDYQRNYIDESRLNGYYKWLAYYTNDIKNNTFDIWQYSSTGRIPGISGNVDLNKSDTDFVTETAEDNGMQIIQSGDKGKAVAIWQIIAGAYPDGEFGAETIKATEIFQEEHGLDIDGIVGPKTWAEGFKSVNG